MHFVLNYLINKNELKKIYKKIVLTHDYYFNIRILTCIACPLLIS